MPKRKLPRPRNGSKPKHNDRLDSMDEMLDCCRKIRALAELLFRSEISSLNPATAATTGALIFDEIKKLRNGLASFQDKS
jgi:hypothetical protein